MTAEFSPPETNDHAAAARALELQSLRENVQRFRLLVENSQDLVIEVTHDGQLLYISPKAKTLLGYEPVELLNTSVFAHVHPEDLAHAREQFGMPAGWAACRYRHKDGSWRWLEITGGDFLSPGGQTRGVLIARDVTRRIEAEQALGENQRVRNQLEAQLRRAQKLDALGTLAGGIAHDFNNVLTVILAYTDLAHMDADEPDKARSHLAEIRKASEHARNLVQQILTFSRHQKQERKPTRLQQVIKEALKQLRSTLPATVEIDERIDSHTPVTLAEPTQIHQVVMNLCMNAAHAMGTRPGRLTVTLQACDVDEALAQTLRGLRPERYARLTVSDTGQGIDAETLRHIYEPFFSTKGPGEGTGLGLAVVHGIVKEHEGVLTVQSQPGVGTTFDVYFPIHQTMPAEVPEIPATLPRGHGEHILFVDDEPAICTSAQIILERLGYRVTVQTDPAEALRQFRNRPDEFALVVTDLTMPRVTGIDLAQHISRLRPQTPVVLATGFNDLWTPDRIPEFGVRALLTKPITPMTLAITLQRALRPAVGNQSSHD